MTGKGTIQRPYGIPVKGWNERCPTLDVDDCTDCKHKTTFGKIYYCTYAPGYLCTSDRIRFSKNNFNILWNEETGKYKVSGTGCMFCKYHCKRIKSETCFDCLSSKELINFKFGYADTYEYEHT